MTNDPTPSQILAALMDAGVDVKTYKGWDTIGRPWEGPDGSPGLMGAVVHHTSTSSAVGSSGCPSLWWATNAYELPVCNLLVGRGPSDTYLLAAGSVYHCGDGGPVPALGIPARGYQGQTRLFGIEIDDAGVSASSLTPYQIETVGRTLAALAGLCGWDVDVAVGTHKCYTDGCHGWNPKGPSPCVGRKNDTIDGAWGEWPGDANPEPYNAPWWRAQAAAWLSTPATWDGTVPSLAAVQKADAEGLANKAAWRVACRLFDLGFMPKPPKAAGKQNYPASAVIHFQVAQGWGNPHGNFSPSTQKRLFGKAKP